MTYTNELVEAVADPAVVAKSLSGPMRHALSRLAAAMVWVDGRSLEALVRRGLARKHGTCDDALFGRFEVVTITPFGTEIHAILEADHD